MDRLVAFADFVRVHRRLPGRQPLLNDVLYRMKTGDEILSPLRVFVSDKELVKLYIKATVGERYNVPTLGVLRSVQEARSYAYPDDCCIKPTHLSGEVILRTRGKPVDFDKIGRWLGSNHYRETREANYRSLEPKVIVEPLIFGSDNVSDYKIFCYGGEPRLIQVDVDRHIGHTRKYFDAAWNELPFSVIYPRADGAMDRPGNLDEMLAVARALCSAFDFVRVDLYSSGAQCLVGEITNCPENATGFFIPRSAEAAASRMIFGAG